MGQRYGLLPSEIMIRATTFDLVIMDSALSYERYVRETSEEGYVPNLSVEELIKIKENV